MDANATRADLRLYRRLVPYLWPAGEPGLRRRVVFAFAMLIAAKLVTVSVPIAFKRAVDALDVESAAGAAIAVPVGLLLAYGALRVLQIAFQELREGLFSRVAQRAVRRLAAGTFAHLHELSLGFHLQRRTGALSRVLERGSKGLQFVMQYSLFGILPTLVEIVLVAGILWSLYDWRFVAVTLATILGYIGFTFVVTEWRLEHRRQLNRSDNTAYTRAVDSLLNYETVKYFNNEAFEDDRFDGSMQRYENAAVRARVSLGLLNVGQGAIIAVGVTAMMLLAGYGVADGSMTLGDFVLVNSYLVQLYIPLNGLGFLYREIKQSMADMEQLFDLLDTPAEIVDAPDARPLEVSRGAVAFEDVAFAYDERRSILRGVSFRVESGRKLAIVGPSGAGKSTIGRLLFRFYDPEQGRVSIDGQDLRHVTQASLRAAIGVVPQDTVLFNDTIAYNIGYARPEASRAEIEDAARRAAIHDFIAGLPDGYDTLVGERGLKLSGGEKQRVAIARTILKNPPILLLDEATSALDTATEREIQRSLDEISRGRTTLVIAHRLSTVISADRIIVLEAGRIVETGTHAELLAADGLYAAMWARQQKAAELSEMLADGTAAGPAVPRT
jgi:ATP-binding cassette subfamily B protein